MMLGSSPEVCFAWRPPEASVSQCAQCTRVRVCACVCVCVCVCVRARACACAPSTRLADAISSQVHPAPWLHPFWAMSLPGLAHDSIVRGRHAPTTRVLYCTPPLWPACVPALIHVNLIHLSITHPRNVPLPPSSVFPRQALWLRFLWVACARRADSRQEPAAGGRAPDRHTHHTHTSTSP